MMVVVFFQLPGLGTSPKCKRYMQSSDVVPMLIKIMAVEFVLFSRIYLLISSVFFVFGSEVDYDLCSICFAEIGNEADYIKMDRPMPCRNHWSFKGFNDPVCRLCAYLDI